MENLHMYFKEDPECLCGYRAPIVSVIAESRPNYPLADRTVTEEVL
jgi:hypothetical protein